MPVLFLDANIFFSATHSQKGASFALFELAKRKKLLLVSNTYALEESRFNIEHKLGAQALTDFYNLVSLLHKVDSSLPSEDEEILYQDIIIQKDLPILVGAIRQNVDFLITLDRKDFMNTKMQKIPLPFAIILPGEYIRTL